MNIKTKHIAKCINNIPEWFLLAKTSHNYKNFRRSLESVGITKTPKNVSLFDLDIDIEALNDEIQDIKLIEGTSKVIAKEDITIVEHKL